MTTNSPFIPRSVRSLVAATLLMGFSFSANAQNSVSATLSIDVSKPGHEIPGNFFGLMTEEINHSYDGGLYAELIQNRSFQDPVRGTTAVPVHWSVVGAGKMSVDAANPVNSALPNSLRLDLTGGESGVANDGYWGIPVRPNTSYTATFYAKAGGSFKGPVTAAITLDDGNVSVAKASSQPISAAWQRYSVTIKTYQNAPTTSKARFVLSANGPGSVSFSLVSLFPPTYQSTANGLRPDLMNLMSDLHPKFIRLPGGNYVEGGRFSDRFNWKQMIGPIDQRPGHMGCWGYRSSDGFGLPEYLLWCKQLGAEPVLAVFAGYVLNGDHVSAGSPEMDVYTKEALEEIEYVSGPANSKWGRKRAADGFPEPFPLHYVEIGNEDWFDRSGSYDGRFTQMAKAIRKRYPHLKIIASAPVKTFKPDVVDDHFYRSSRQLVQMATMYDMPTGTPPPLTFNGGGYNGRQPDGTKIFVGEWAAQEGRPTPNLSSAIGDAAFLMGLEKNSDAVIMECYAPLFVNVNPADAAKGYPKAWQWNTNLIGYDALNSFGSASYYAQVMLAKNKGDVVLPAKLSMTSVSTTRTTTADNLRGGIGVGSWHTQVEYSDINVTSPSGEKLFSADSTGDKGSWRSAGGEWRVQGNKITPASSDAETWTTTGDRNWTDYTIRLRARKLSGNEGFIVVWHAADRNQYHWWNIGGWGNTQARCEASENGARTAYGQGAPFVVEADRWYDLRLEVAGSRMRGFVDGKLVTDSAFEGQVTTSTVVATSTFSKSDNTVIIKVVNPDDRPVDVAISLKGMGKVEANGTAIVLAGDLLATNSLEEPMKVAPKQQVVSGVSSEFHHTFQPHSFTILRLKAMK
ncbi:MAG: alpha-L-arabinofuranosidase C-terminal domain-containing protein [Chthonomonadales bacterium]